LRDYFITIPRTYRALTRLILSAISDVPHFAIGQFVDRSKVDECGREVHLSERITSTNCLWFEEWHLVYSRRTYCELQKSNRTEPDGIESNL